MLWIWGGHFIQVILSSVSIPSVNMHLKNTRKSGDGREWRIIKTSCFIWRRMNSWSCVPRAVMQTHLSFISVTLHHSTPLHQSMPISINTLTGLCVAGKEILLLHFLLRQEQSMIKHFSYSFMNIPFNSDDLFLDALSQPSPVFPP